MYGRDRNKPESADHESGRSYHRYLRCAACPLCSGRKQTFCRVLSCPCFVQGSLGSYSTLLSLDR